MARRHRRVKAFAALLFGATAVAAQSPRDANPERPTYATHAYAVAPGYAELEQGVSVRGIHSLGDATSWDVNLKFGLSAWMQFALFGPLYLRGPGGGGVGDLGAALKVRGDLSRHAALALVTSITAPTGSTARGLGAGRSLGSLTGVVSADLPGGIHVDINAGPQGIGAGTPQLFTSLSSAYGRGAAGITLEAFNFTAGAAGPRFAGLLGALTFRFERWAVADAGGVLHAAPSSPNQVFVGITTNLGRVIP
jgi:hypothetical protein